MHWLRRIFHKEQAERHLDAELRFHLERQVSDYVAAGIPAEEARRRAHLDFGGLESIKQQTRESRRGHFLDTLAQDIRLGLRMLRKSPGFTVVAILTLALGIGANTAIFSLINAVMLRSLPIPYPQEVVLLRWAARRAPNIMGGYNWDGCLKESGDPTAIVPKGCSFSYHMYQQIHTQQTVFSGTSAFIGSSYLRMKVDGRPVKVYGDFVGGDFFSTLGLRAEMGRMLDASDDAPGAEPVAVLRYGYWQNQFGADPAVIGRRFLLEDNVVTIVGVTPPGFTGLDPGISDDVWLPLSFHFRLFPDEFRLDNPANTWAEIVARLKPAVTRAQAEAAITAIFAPTVISGPDAPFKPEDKPRIELPELAHGLVSLREEFSKSLFFLMVAVGLILLIASANIAGLMLSRAASRQREIAVRLALGARRRRILRQLFTESLMVVMAAAALGILLAYWGASSLAVFLSANWHQPLQIDVRPDAHILLFTATIATFVGIFFGLAPGLRSTRVDLTHALKGSAERVNLGSHGEKRSLGLGSALVIAQVALSMVVLVGAGLLVHTLVNLQTMNVGFDTRNVLLLSIDPNIHEWKDPRLQYVQRDLQARLASIPGVISVSYSMVPLLSGSNMDTMFQALNTPIESRIRTDELPVGTRFFETMHIELLGGRTFNAADFEAKAKPQPVIVNQMLAHLLFGETNPIGRFFSDSGSKTVDYEVIGLVADAKYAALRSGVKPTAYLPLKVGGASFELRTAGEPKAFIPAVRAAVSEVNSNVLITGIRTQKEQIDRTLYQERLVAGLSSLFGVLALGLACIGLYGLLAYEVTRRTHEIGVRMALGAAQRDVVRLVVWRGLSLAAAGTVIGIAAAASLTRFVRTLLYGTKPVDPMSFISAAVLLFAVAVAACYIPARRATRVDPMVALRYE